MPQAWLYFTVVSSLNHECRGGQGLLSQAVCVQQEREMPGLTSWYCPSMRALLIFSSVSLENWITSFTVSAEGWGQQQENQ